MKSVVIAGYARSPFTPAAKGVLAQIRPDEMAAQVIRALIGKTGVKPDEIEDLILGCAFPEAEQGFNMGRLVSFLADLPIAVAGVTVNRFCGSSMQSVHMAAGAIQMDAGEAFLCAGVESMSRIPMTGFNPMPHPGLFAENPAAYMSMGETAENVATKYAIDRLSQEKFAVASHEKAAKAQAADNFKDEIIPITMRDEIVDTDGCIRPETSLDSLHALKPAFHATGSVTAATASPLTDGAAAVLVTSEAYATANNLPVLARIKSIAVSGCAPEIMGIGPVSATQKALKRASITVDDLNVIELNEAFASQSLAVIQELNPPQNAINIDGGALALGHPLGATGARIVGKAAQLLKRDGGKYALATQCIGGGQGIATVLEAV